MNHSLVTLGFLWRNAPGESTAVFHDVFLNRSYLWYQDTNYVLKIWRVTFELIVIRLTSNLKREESGILPAVVVKRHPFDETDVNLLIAGKFQEVRQLIRVGAIHHNTVDLQPGKVENKVWGQFPVVDRRSEKAREGVLHHEG